MTPFDLGLDDQDHGGKPPARGHSSYHPQRQHADEADEPVSFEPCLLPRWVGPGNIVYALHQFTDNRHQMAGGHTTASDGERRALVGYVPQYRLCAEFAYEALTNGRLEWLQLLSNAAGQIDDFLVASPGRLDANQVKHGERAETYTLYSLLSAPKTGGDKQSDPLFRQLAVGWERLKGTHPSREVHVHLTLRGIPTSIGSIEGISAESRGESFQEFLAEGWGGEIPGKWLPVVNTIREVCELDAATFEEFRRHCHLDFFPAVEPKPAIKNEVERGRDQDVEKLKLYLLNLVSADQRPGPTSKDSLLRDLGWDQRFRAAYPQEFRVDPRYQPIAVTVQAIQQALLRFNRGYIGLIGSPGSGKSTTLTHTLRKQGGYRLVRYYAYIPDDSIPNRGEAQSFLHDVVAQLRQQGVRGVRGFAPESLPDLQIEFSAQLQELDQKWKAQGVKTVILVDGLDHIEREQNPQRSLLAALPAPEAIPEGVLICLGSQKKELKDLVPGIFNQLDEPGRTIEMEPLARSAVYAYIAASKLPFPLSTDQSERVFALSEGHPLALALLIEKLREARSAHQITVLLDASTGFGGHIEKSYEMHWCRLEKQKDLTLLLAYLSRMRGTADLAPLVVLVSESAVEQLRQIARPYIRFVGATGCQFFHNSFRQFVLSKTGRSAFGEASQERHKKLHRDLAELASKLPFDQPFSWQAVYHAYCAGDFEWVLRIATAGYFRAQALAVRPGRAIFSDLRLVFGAVKETNRPLAAVATALIFREMRRRFNDEAEMHLPSLLLALRGPDACLEYVLQEELTTEVAPGNALDTCEVLLEAGNEEHAQRLFELSEPLAILEGGETLRLHLPHDSSILIRWAAIAWRFRPAVEVLAALLRVKIDAGDALGVRSPEEIAKTHRVRALEAILLSLADHAAWNELDEALEFLCEHPFFAELQTAVDWRVCWEHPKDPRAATALGRLEAEARASNPDSNAKLALANQVWRIRGDRTGVEDWLSGTECPKPQERLSYENRLDAFRDRLIHCRLLAIVGRPLRSIDAVRIPDEPRRQVAALIERVVAEVGTFWGRGVAGDKADEAEVRALTTTLIRFFDQEHLDREDRFGWHSAQQGCPKLFKWFVFAVAAHGPEALRVLQGELDRRWTACPPRWPWSLDHQREVALTLFEVDPDRDALVRRLTRVEAGSDIFDDPGSRVNFLSSQSSAWLRGGEKERAQDCFRRMLATSLGIQSGDEDDEAYYWVEWFARQADAVALDLRSDIEVLANALAVLEQSGRGRRVPEAMLRLARVAGEVSEDWGEHLWSSWLEKGVASWTDAIRGTLRSLVNRNETPIGIINVAVRRLLLPWEVSADRDLPDAFLSVVYGARPGNQVDDILRLLVHTLATKAFPRVRRVWFEAIERAAGRVGRLPPRMPTVESEDESEAPTPPREKLVKMADGTERPLESAVLTVNSVASGMDLLKANLSGYSIAQETVVDCVFPRLQASDLEKFAARVLQEISAPEALAALSTRFLDAGLPNFAFAIAERALESAPANGWAAAYEGGTCLSAAAALVRADPSKGPGLVLRRWLNDVAAGETGMPHMFEQFDRLLHFFVPTGSRRELWKLLQAHFMEFAEVRENPERFPPLRSVPAARPVAATIMNWLQRGCELGVPDVEDESFRGIFELAQLRTCDEAVSALLKRWFAKDDVCQQRGLSLLDLVSQARPACVADFTAEVQTLQNSHSFVVQAAASRLARKLGFPAVQKTPVELSPVYAMSLPPIPEPEHRIPSDFYGPGSVTPETEDHWEWVVVVEDELKILAKASGIPLQNLVHRMATLMKEVSPRALWNAEAESAVKSRIERAGLRLSYGRPRAAVAWRAFSRMLAELLAAKRITSRLAGALRSRIDPVDLYSVRFEPSRRPEEVHLPTQSEISAFRNEKWLQGPAEALPRCLSRAQGGSVVLAELTKIRFWDRGGPEEIRMSCWSAPNWRSDNSTEPIFSFFASRTWWRMDEYPALVGAQEIEALAILLYPVFVHIGHGDWLAPNPAPCHALGWQLDGQGAYRWVCNGEVMVQTLYWMDGPRKRAEVHNEDVTAEGWLVLAAPAAAEQLARCFPSIVRRQVIRILNQDSAEEEQISSAEQEVQTTEILGNSEPPTP